MKGCMGRQIVTISTDVVSNKGLHLCVVQHRNSSVIKDYVMYNTEVAQ